jgi:CHAD domain-containing protein
MPETAREREDKYEVPSGFAIPDLRSVLPDGGSLEEGTVHLTSTYFDTDAHDLRRARLTLRRRDGDADVGWHLKLPAGIARTEVREPLTENLPQRLLDLTLGVRGGRSLRRVAELRTERRVCRLLTADRALLAEVADDRVHAAGTGAGASVSEWREIEVELGTAGEDLLTAVGGLLRTAGAIPASYGSKLQRALTPPLPAQPEPAAPTVGSTVQAYLAEQVSALLTGDVGLRRGEDVVHPTRVAARRMRSTLRTFRRLFTDGEAAELESELRWLTQALGAVRDVQVLHRRLIGELEALPPELVLGAARARIDEALIGARARNAEELQQLMAGERYLQVLDSVRLFVADPPFAPRASRSAHKIEKDVARAGKKLATRLDDALADGSDESLHRARKAAKRARYAVEAAASVLPGKPAEAIDRLKSLQDLLGEQHDAVVAADLLLDLGRQAGDRSANGFTLGLLYQRQQDASERARAQLPHLAGQVTATSPTG